MVIRIDGSFLLSLGKVLQNFTNSLHVGRNLKDNYEWIPVWSAQNQVSQFLESVFQPRVSHERGKALVDLIQSTFGDNFDHQLTTTDVNALSHAVNEFETVLRAELQVADLYLMYPKGGFSTQTMISRPAEIFPDDLLSKVPDSALDVQQLGLCLAFDLPTAAAFHLHRINEAVLRRYYVAVANGADPPKSGNMGSYLCLLKKLTNHDAKLLATLNAIKDHYRNPVMHPEQSVETIDDAFGLLGLIRTAVVQMLKEIASPSV